MALYEDIQRIYSHLQDVESKNIFRLWGDYSLTGEPKYLDEFVKILPERRYLDEGRLGKAYIFGCGCFGKIVHDNLKMAWAGFTDNNRELWGVNCYH